MNHFWVGIGKIASALAILGLIYAGINKMCNFIWPYRKNWSANLLNSAIWLQAERAVNWRTDRIIHIDDCSRMK